MGQREGFTLCKPQPGTGGCCPLGSPTPRCSLWVNPREPSLVLCNPNAVRRRWQSSTAVCTELTGLPSWCSGVAAGMEPGCSVDPVSRYYRERERRKAALQSCITATKKCAGSFLRKKLHIGKIKYRNKSFGRGGGLA